MNFINAYFKNSFLLKRYHPIICLSIKIIPLLHKHSHTNTLNKISDGASKNMNGWYCTLKKLAQLYRDDWQENEAFSTRETSFISFGM